MAIEIPNEHHFKRICLQLGRHSRFDLDNKRYPAEMLFHLRTSLAVLNLVLYMCTLLPVLWD